MAVLVNRLAAEPEIPIDHFDRAVEHELVEARLLDDLAPRRLGGRLAGFEMPFRESPILVRVANQQKGDLTVRATAEDHATRTGLALGAGLGLATLGATTSHFLEDAEREVFPRIGLNIG